MARPRADTHDQQRALIRDQAAQEFARLGYASASMADLAQACSVSKAALYHYFDSKETILFEALDSYTHRLQALTRTDSDSNSGVNDLSPTQAQARLAGLVKALLAEYANSHSYHVSLLHDVKFLGPAQREAIQAQERAVVHHVGNLINRAFPGRIDPDKRSATTMSLLGMINFSFAWWDPKGPLNPEQLADLMIDLWWRALGPA